MADKPELPNSAFKLPHLRIDAFASPKAYRPPRRSMSKPESDRQRFSHGGKLSAELAQALAAAHRMLAERDESIAAGKPGAYVEIASKIDDALPDKGWGQQGIRIAAVRLNEDGAEVGGLFVPTKAETFLSETLSSYQQGAGSDAAAARIEQIERIAPATVETLWVDRRPLPAAGQRIWWECWCWKETAKNLIRPAERLGLRISEQRLLFPDFEVIPVYAAREDVERLLANSDAIEELRHASDNPHVYTHDLAKYQVPLVKDLESRITPAPESAPAACILDTGVTRAHPLLAPSLAVSDWHAVDQNWLADDHYRYGHGTQVAGTALLGDLTYPLGDQRQIALTHRLESVKLLPPNGFPPTDPANLGIVTQSAISLPEGEAPERLRVFCMTVTNEDLSGDRPTSWSAAIDQAAAGTMPGELDDPAAPKRLILISAGNIPDDAKAEEAADPARFPIEDPGQAWNTLTIGGFTDRDNIADPLYRTWSAAAAVGDRSPYSRMSRAWPDTVPIKPDIVFEAGNRALSPNGTDFMAGIESLSVLATNKDWVSDPLCPFWATSAATGEGARMAAQIMAAHPDYWPETVRALMVHSARWTPAMRQRIKSARGRKAQHIALAREFGYGVPHLNRALASAESDLGLMAQTSLQPFKVPMKQGKRGHEIPDGTPKFNEVHIYDLPWPRQRLEELGEKRVELRVTLSYFIEPSPGQYAPVTPARYRSHGLRFDLQRRTENEQQFLERINDLAEAEERGEDGVELSEQAGEAEELSAAVVEVETEADRGWIFGPNSRANRTAGSLHCDVWQGPGADLAARRTLAVYPVAGWWKNRMPKKRYNSKARYALVMTLRCLDEDVDLYSEIEAGIAAKIANRASAQIDV